MSEELKRPDNYDNWPTMWKSCFEDGVNAERNRRQEAKPLTVEQWEHLMNQAINDYYNEARPDGTPDREEFLAHWFYDHFHAALPPDQSARIKELEDKYTELAQFDNLRLQKLQAERNAFESKIARAIEILKKPYKFDQGALIKLFRDIAEAIQILEAKNE